jgi:hypothetical protein
VLLKLARIAPGWTIRSFADEVGIPRSAVHRALGRLDTSGLTIAQGKRVNAPAAIEFLVHGLRYVFPPRFSGQARGVPTAWAAEPLVTALAPQGGEPPVWPDPLGSTFGVALAPLHPVAPTLARTDPQLAESLALLDGLRIGDARMRGLAAELLGDRLTEQRMVL